MELTKKLSVRTIKGDNSMKYLIWKLHCDRNKEEFSSISKEMRQVEGLYVEMSGLKDWLRKKEMKEK